MPYLGALPDPLNQDLGPLGQDVSDLSRGWVPTEVRCAARCSRRPTDLSRSPPRCLGGLGALPDPLNQNLNDVTDLSSTPTCDRALMNQPCPCSIINSNSKNRVLSETAFAHFSAR